MRESRKTPIIKSQSFRDSIPLDCELQKNFSFFFLIPGQDGYSVLELEIFLP